MGSKDRDVNLESIGLILGEHLGIPMEGYKLMAW